MNLRDMWETLRSGRRIDAGLLLGVTLVFVIQSIGFLNKTVYFNGRPHRVLLMETNPYVTSTLKLLSDNGIQGPIFNCTLLGGPILWSDYPKLRPFDDGRHLDYKRFNDNINILLDPKDNWQKAAKAYGFKIAVLSEGYKPEARVIKYLQSQMTGN